MTSWADVAMSFVDFLKKWPRYGLAILGVVAVLAMYVAPMWFMGQLWKDSTSQIVGAVHELRQDLKGYINNQMASKRVKYHLPE